MSISPEVDLSIATGKTTQPGHPLYYIKVEVTSATDIIPEIFVLVRTDAALNQYEYSRVASLKDIQEFGTTPVTENASYRASNFTIKTNSLSFIKEFKEELPVVVQHLLDSAKQSDQVSNLEQVTNVTIVGESY